VEDAFVPVIKMTFDGIEVGSCCVITALLYMNILLSSSNQWLMNEVVVMAALHSRCRHYIFALWFLSVFFSSPFFLT